jgi:hypothetical protein
MKRLLFAAAAAASLTLAPPVLAQSYPATPPGTDAAPGHDIRGQLDALRQRVKTGFDQGQLSHSETDRLYREIDRIGAVEQSDRLSDGNLRDHDRTDLQARIDGLSRSIHWQRAEGGVAPVAVAETVPPPEPVAAPPPADGVWSLDQRENWLQGRIDRGVDDHRLSGKEAERGQSELYAIRTEEARLLERDGGALSPEDRSYLVNRLDQLNQTLRWEGRNPPPPWAAGF